MKTASVFFGIGSALAMGYAFYGVLRCARFAKRLNEYLENPQLDEAGQLRSALRFLQESISVTATEREALLRDIEKTERNAEDKKNLLVDKLADLTEIKVKHLKRRTSTRSLILISNESEKILKLLDAPSTEAQGIQEAKELIKVVQTDSLAKKMLNVASLIAATIGLIASLLFLVGTFGSVPFLLFGISGAIYLLSMLYYYAAKGLHKKVELKTEQGET